MYQFVNEQTCVITIIFTLHIRIKLKNDQGAKEMMNVCSTVGQSIAFPLR